MGTIQFGDGFLLFVDHSAKAEDDGLVDAGDIDGKCLVERNGTVLVLVGGGDGAGLARLERFPRPLGVGAAAGCDHLIDGNGLLADVLDFESTALRSVVHADVPEIVDRLVKLHDVAYLDGVIRTLVRSEGHRGLFHGLAQVLQSFLHLGAAGIPAAADGGKG